MEHFVGIDVHKAKCVACVVDGTGEVIARGSFPTTASGVEGWLANWLPGKVLIEATTVSEFVAGVIDRRFGVGQVVVCDPGFAPTYSYKQKTDKGDAASLAQACRLGNYRAIHRSSARSRERRTLVEARIQEVKQRTERINFVRSKASEQGVMLPRCESETFHRRVLASDLPKPLDTLLSPTLAGIAECTARIEAYDKQIEALRESDPVIERMRAIAGPQTAALFSAVIDEPTRFKTPHKAQSYLGLVPQERSSGASRHLSGITRRGNTDLRRCLVQSAAGILRSTAPKTAALRSWAHRLREKRGWLVAVVALARKLAGILFAMWRDDAVFDPGKSAAPIRPPSPPRKYALKATRVATA